MDKKAFDIAINEEIVNKKKIFVAHCLNLGIASQGYTYEEALENYIKSLDLGIQNPELVRSWIKEIESIMNKKID